jgi:hypothetical protein
MFKIPMDQPFRLHLARLKMILNPFQESQLNLLSREWRALLAIGRLKAIDYFIQINQFADRFRKNSVRSFRMNLCIELRNSTIRNFNL